MAATIWRLEDISGNRHGKTGVGVARKQVDKEERDRRKEVLKG